MYTENTLSATEDTQYVGQLKMAGVRTSGMGDSDGEDK